MKGHQDGKTRPQDAWFNIEANALAHMYLEQTKTIYLLDSKESMGMLPTTAASGETAPRTFKGTD